VRYPVNVQKVWGSLKNSIFRVWLFISTKVEVISAKWSTIIWYSKCLVSRAPPPQNTEKGEYGSAIFHCFPYLLALGYTQMEHRGLIVRTVDLHPWSRWFDYMPEDRIFWGDRSFLQYRFVYNFATWKIRHYFVPKSCKTGSDLKNFHLCLIYFYTSYIFYTF
jgi:hypothetical protein